MSLGVIVITAIMTIATRRSLHTAATMSGAQLSAGDLLVTITSDAYLLVYLLAPGLAAVVAVDAARRSETTSILRQGSYFAYTRDQIIRGLLFGLATSLLMIATAIAAASGLGWSREWSALAAPRSPSPYATVLDAFAGRHLSHLSAILLQSIHLVLWTGLVSALSALMAIRCARRSTYTAGIVALALLPLVSFKAWPGSPATNPVNGLLAYHAIGVDLPTWTAPLGASLAVLLTLAASWPLGRAAIGWRHPLAAYATVLTLGAAALFTTGPTQSLTDIVRTVNYGAGASAWSITHWAYSMMVWLGGAYILLVRWSDLLLERTPLILVRYGSMRPLLRDELIRASAAALIVGLWTTAVAALISIVAGAWAAPDSTVLYHQLVNGPLQMVTYALVAVGLMLWTQRATAALVGLGGCLIFSLPIVNPSFIAPFGLAGHGATDTVSPLRITITLVITSCLLCLVIFQRATRPGPIDIL